MDQIGSKTVNAIADGVVDVLEDHRNTINEAYLKLDGKLSLTITVAIGPDPDGNKCDIGLSFVKERVKDSVTRIVKEQQLEMFEGGGE